MSILSSQKQSVNTDFPNVRPSLDLRFALAKKLDPRITFTRGSTGTYFGPDGIMRTAGVNEPRFDHNPTTGESLGLLVEEQRTNLLLRSEEFDNPSWIPFRATVSANGATAPNGQAVADTITEDTTSNSHGVLRTVNALVNASSYTASCYIRASGRDKARLVLLGTSFSTGTAYANFNLVAVTATPQDGVTASITSAGSGWFRCVMTATANAAGASDLYIQPLNASGAANYLGSGAAAISVWGAQLETGAFPTSYIPTTASTVTRSADNAFMTGTNFSSWYNQNEGTIYCVYKNNTTDFTTRKNVYSISGNSEIELRSPNISSNRLRFVFNGQFNSNPTQVSASLNQRKTAFSFNQNRHYAYIDSEYVIPSTIHINDNTKNILILGNRIQGATDYLNGTISRLTYYPIQLTNQQLTNLTS